MCVCVCVCVCARSRARARARACVCVCVCVCVCDHNHHTIITNLSIIITVVIFAVTVVVLWTVAIRNLVIIYNLRRYCIVLNILVIYADSFICLLLSHTFMFLVYLFLTFDPSVSKRKNILLPSLTLPFLLSSSFSLSPLSFILGFFLLVYVFVGLSVCLTICPPPPSLSLFPSPSLPPFHPQASWFGCFFFFFFFFTVWCVSLCLKSKDREENNTTDLYTDTTGPPNPEYARHQSLFYVEATSQHWPHQAR